jgi:hypothetical protein
MNKDMVKKPPTIQNKKEFRRDSSESSGRA